MDPNTITYFAETDARNKKIKFGIKAKDRLKHMYIIGKTGMGKSTLLENMAIQDIQNGNGIALIDPHGGTAEKLLEYVPQDRIKDVLYFAPFDMEHPVSFNVMEDIGIEKRHLVLGGLMSAFKKLFGEESFSDRMQYILQNTILALLEYPEATMLGINRMLSEKDYRNKVIANITDPSVKTYWVKEYAGYTERFAAEAIPAIQNKIGQFTSNPLVRNIIGQVKSSFDIRKMMDERKIMIINLSKGRLGEGNANLIGSMLITKIYLAAMSRADSSEQELAKLPNFYLYVDEFQSFANKSFADILSEARKYKLNLTIAHQYIEQMEEEVRDAVFGNVGTMITFRVGAYDAEVLEKEFAPVFTAEDLVNLGYIQVYLKLMIDGISSKPFSATTMAPIHRPEISFKNDVIESSRAQFARPRAVVEKNIVDWHDSGTVREAKSLSTPANFTPSSSSPVPQRSQNDHTFQESEKVISRTSVPPPPPQIDENKQAFLKASEELKRKEQEKPTDKPAEKPKETVSLSSLNKDLNTQAGKKAPSKENISSLKAALSSVMQTPKVVEDKKIGQKVEHKDETHKHTPDVKKEPTEGAPVKENSTKPREVPEEVLKSILSMDEKK